MGEAPKCEKCGQPMTPETTVHLWDGKDYCRDCVVRAAPGLLDYARAHDRLQERMPFNLASMTWTLVVFIGVINAVLICLMLVPVAMGGFKRLDSGALQDVLYIVAFVDLPMFAAVGVYLLLARFRPPMVYAAKGMVMGMPHWPLTMRKVMRLAGCSWYTGKLAHSVGMGTVPMIEVVFLEMRTARLGGMFTTGGIVNCGWTEETLAVWKGFLTLAGVRKLTTKEARQTGRLRTF